MPSGDSNRASYISILSDYEGQCLCFFLPGLSAISHKSKPRVEDGGGVFGWVDCVELRSGE